MVDLRFLSTSNLRVETVTKPFHETALHVAAEHDHSEIAELLLDTNRGAVDSLKEEKLRVTALHVVAEAGYVATCRVLVRHGADVSRTTAHGSTPLHLAARGCNVEVINIFEKYLLVTEKYLQVLSVLLERAARADTELVNARDGDGRTALVVASSSESQGATDCMRELIRAGAALDLQNSHGNTALHNAAIGQ